MSPFTVVDAVLTHLRAKAELAANSEAGLLAEMAQQLVDGHGQQKASFSAGVNIEPEGRIVIVGSVAGRRLKLDEFRSSSDPAKAACNLFLRYLVDHLVGWPGQSVYGDFVPVVGYVRAMGTAVLRDPESAHVAAQALWANTRAEFYIIESEGDKRTQCAATTVPDGWAGDLANR